MEQKIEVHKWYIGMEELVFTAAEGGDLKPIIKALKIDVNIYLFC